ncbi:transposable element tcb1 transposase [Trichonephila clavipes]|uniref:Transposable element tcb1 transposase n=1 Tax=Trichonephila clavipes TaxID=2585209 RepID=A0A8X6R777_TRICX|nr:transposable element tcb1 transposase [Trichonephila clavipes]
MKLKDRDRRRMSKEMRKNYTKPMPHILQQFRQVSGSVVSIITIHKEAHLFGFQGHAAAHKPLIIKSNHAVSLSWCKTLRN